MSEENLSFLLSVASEIEATTIVDVLAERGIRAVSSGGLKTGFKAEAPGEVSVLVAADDVDRAGQILDEYHAPSEPTAVGSGPVVFACDACGEQVTFDAETRGTVQSCPECAEWLDVPGG